MRMSPSVRVVIAEWCLQTERLTLSEKTSIGAGVAGPDARFFRKPLAAGVEPTYQFTANVWRPALPASMVIFSVNPRQPGLSYRINFSVNPGQWRLDFNRLVQLGGVDAGE